MIQVVTNVLHDLFLLLSEFLSRFFGDFALARNYLIPGLAIGIAISAVFLGIKLIRSFINN